MYDDLVVYDEPAEEIVVKARAFGVAFSKEQLGDWHRAGLIPAPKTEFPGGGGSKSIYPRGSLRQAMACATLMGKFRSYDKVGWVLWLNRFPVREDVWRKQFVEAQKAFITLHKIGVEDEEFTDKTDYALSEIAKNNRPPKWIGLIRRRLGQQISNAIALVLAAAIGRLLPTDGSEACADEKLFNRLLGLTAASKKKKIQVGTLLPDSGNGFRGRLDQMGSVLRQLGDYEHLERYSLADFSRAREEFEFLVMAYFSVRNAEMQITGQLGADAKLLQKIFQTLDAPKQAGLILIWLVCREIPSWQKGLEFLVSNIQAEINRRKQLQDSLPK